MGPVHAVRHDGRWQIPPFLELVGGKNSEVEFIALYCHGAGLPCWIVARHERSQQANGPFYPPDRAKSTTLRPCNIVQPSAFATRIGPRSRASSPAPARLEPDRRQPPPISQCHLSASSRPIRAFSNTTALPSNPDIENWMSVWAIILSAKLPKGDAFDGFRKSRLVTQLGH